MKREPILLSRLKKPGAKGKIVIGIAATHHGAGATHLSVLLATYMSEYLRLKTAFIECAPKRDIHCIKSYFFGEREEEGEDGTFSIQRITFYENKNVQGIAEIMGDIFDCVILDLGMDINKYKGEFLRCDKKIVVSSLVIWREEELKNFLKNTEHIKNSEQWIYAIPFVQDKVITRGRKEMKRQLFKVPYEEDPFVLSDASIQFFQKIL